MKPHKGTMAVALLDVLGFSALVQEMDPEELYRASVGRFDVMMERSTSARMWTENDLGKAVFSDTIFLWLEPTRLPDGRLDGFACVQDMVLVVRGLMQRGMRRHIPLRGAIAYGECFVSDLPMALIGKPVVDAYKLERAQQWSGVALCASATDQLGDLTNMAPPPFCPVVPFPVPLKLGPQPLLAIKWSDAFDLPHPRAAMRAPSAALDETERESVRQKIENTAAFFDLFPSRSLGGLGGSQEGES